MALAQLDSLRATLAENSAISAMVDGKIYKFKPIEKSELDLKSAPNKSLISCEVGDWNGEKTSLDPVFVVDIRSRKGTDGGAEYCAEIAKAVKELLDGGFGTGAEAVSVSKIRGEVVFEKDLMGYRCRLEVFGHIKTALSLSITSSLASPQPAESDVVFVAVASPAEGLEYRFLVLGPGTGGQWRDMTGWQSRNSFEWKTSEQDIGSSAIKVQARGGRNKIAEDAEAAIGYTITAASGGSGSGSLPTIISFMPSFPSPQPPGLEIDLICTASDAEGNELFYKFLHQPPATAYWKDLTSWQSRNWTTWKPTLNDSGVNSLKVQVIDGKHAEKGGCDATTTISYTIAP